MLRIEGLRVQYGELLALDDLTLHVDAGEVVAIVGANGAGKSTLLSAISGVVARRGSIRFEDTDLTPLPAHAIVDLGIVHIPEGRRLFPFMTVRENLEMGAFSPRARAGRHRRLEEVFALLPRLSERAGQLAHTLSGGEQQMCAIGRGLMAGPRLLMLDEPTLGLAPMVSEEVFRLVATIRAAGTTVVIVEQQVARTLQTADRGYVLEAGRLTMQGRGADLLADDELRRAYLGL
jgi:branched-chain amino acid transport system ATP-binding protein